MNKYGEDIPILIEINIKNIITDDWVKAAVSAVPTKGAEHGVAINVAKKPLKKSWILSFLDELNIGTLLTIFGREIVKKPNKFNEDLWKEMKFHQI